MAGFKSICRWLRVPQIILFILLLLVFPNASFALDYKITEVIEIGEADFVPFLGPLKWSPDGTKLAFFKDGILKISDTLGKVSEVTKLEVAPHKYDWISNEKIAVHFRIFPGPSIQTQEKLVLVDVSTGKLSIIHEFDTAPGYRKEPGKTTSSGPYETVEGNKFYLYTTYNPKSGKTKVERKSFLEEKAESLKNNHILRWGDDGLYKVKLDESDSVWLGKKPFARMGYKQIISTDLSYAMDGGQIFNLRDSSIIVLDTLLGEPPENTNVCGVVWFSFNPVANEVAFTISCDDGHNYVVHRIATYDCVDQKLTVLDSLIGISDCATPIFSSDGRRIAFIANSKVYILVRDVN